MSIKVWQKLSPVLIPLGAILLAFIFGAFVLFALGANPLQAYGALLEGAFGNTNAFADTLVKATPLLFVAVGICVSFRGGVLNIGAEGQFIMGALAGSILVIMIGSAPGWILIIAACLMGFLGGAFWGLIPGYLKAYLNVNEVLSTIMMNVIAVQIMNFLLTGPLIDPVQIERGTRIPETARFPLAADLPRLVPTRLHLGFAMAIIAAIVIWILLWRTPLGYRIRAVGLNPFASKYAGISIGRHAMLAMTISGALAGLGGAVQVLGLHHRMFTDGSAAGFTGSTGFNGIVVALFGGLHPLGSIPASILFGALLVGANKLQREVQVPSALAVALNGLVVIFVVASQIWIQRINDRAQLAEIQELAEESETSEVFA